MTQPPPFLALDPHRHGLSRPLSDDIACIDALLGAVLDEQREGDVLDIARRLYRDVDLDPQALFSEIPALADARILQRVIRAYTLLFQLMNTAEQKEIVRVNRQRHVERGDAPRPESIAKAVEALRRAGVDAPGMQALIDRLDVCPTLTAHPTEARRRSVLDKLQTIAEALVERALPPEAPNLDAPLDAAREAAGRLRRALTALWQTDELRASPLTVVDEATNTLYFFGRSIFKVVAWLHEDLRAALELAYPGERFRIGRFVRYRSWVGGDRDGNPNVTPAITWNTLRRHKACILEHYLGRIDALRRELTQSTRLAAASGELLQSLEADGHLVPLSTAELRRYRLEPYALKLVYVHARLRATLDYMNALEYGRHEHAAPPAAAYPAADAFLDDLSLVRSSLRDNRGGALADEGALAALCAQAATFGFHLAALDVRQHSDEHAAAVAEMLVAAGLIAEPCAYDDMPEEEKVRLLSCEILDPRPLLALDAAISERARSVLDVFRVVRDARRQLSREATDTYIISMTHGVSDVLEVLLLAKEAGLLRRRANAGRGAIESDLDVVPLFETIDDLRRCEGLMRELFDEPAYRAHLDARGTFQEIMLGYSDSSKDGGFLAANLTLYDTQARLARACGEANVAVRFFHGRGGTVGRGGGRANRAILSQPPGSFSGSIRFTEQGEVISFRYGVPPLGHRHMEQIVSAALLASSERTAQPAIEAEWLDALQQMAARSLEVYRALVHDDPEFWDFYAQATPIRHISRLPIASRPASRSRKLGSVDALRAIPWVFAWVQSRYVVPGWYGLGSALKSYGEAQSGNVGRLCEMYRDWLFFRMVINNAQLELLRADIDTAAWYAKRVEPPELATRMHEQLAAEHRLSREWALRITGHDALVAHAPVVRRTVELRNPALRPLSMLQAALLQRLAGDDAPDPAWQEAMLLSIIGIAAGMQSTG